MSWRRVLVLVSVLLPLGAAVACTEPIEKPPAGGGSVIGANIPGNGGDGGDGGSDGGVTVSDAGDGGVCTDLTATGQVIDRVGVAGEPAAGRGGTVVDGEYNLTDYTVFTGAGGAGGPTGITAKASLRITAGKLEQRYEFGGSGNPSVRVTSGSYAATAATFATTELCPGSTAATLQFTANDTILVLTDTRTKEAFTFTKR
jgi:hypothetical protein